MRPDILLIPLTWDTSVSTLCEPAAVANLIMTLFPVCWVPANATR